MNIDEMFSGLEKQKAAKSYTPQEGIITEVEQGKVRDFVSAEYLKSFDNPDSDVVNVVIMTPDNYTCNKMLTVSIHPNSNLQRYFNKYSVYPKIEGKFPLKFEGGFWRPQRL